MTVRAPTHMARLQRVDRGSQFRAYGLHGADMIDPFLGIDHVWIGGPTFPPHPHAGFSAVSYVFPDSETGIDNRDSLGHRNLIRPGGLHWTAGGRGVVHEEVPAEIGKTTHMLQIFVNLPRERQGDAPFMLSLASEDVPVVQVAGARVRTLLGRYGEARSPLAPPTDVSLLDIALEHGAELTVPVAAGEGALVIPIFGSLSVDGQQIGDDAPAAPIFEAQATASAITLRASQGPANAMLFAGAPLRQPVHWRGPMAMASAEALATAVAAYQRGEFGQV